ncbi:hypothetical protein [Propionicimonas sp.]|uniref:hypothetical protein n=1 Tax=Propionicimonas sp. TaxID=1955623 RepID=UPI0039E54A9E
MTTALVNQITLAERNLAGVRGLDAAARLSAAEPTPSLRELFARLIPAGAKRARRTDPTYQPA